MTKTLNQIIIFPPPKSEYLFQQHWNQNIFLEKKHNQPLHPPPFKLNGRSLIVGIHYRPPNRTDNEYVNNSINELSELCTGSNNATVWIGGDFNLGDISWPSGNITCSNHTNKLNRSFLNACKDFGNCVITLIRTDSKFST